LGSQNSGAEAPELDLLGDPYRPLRDPRGRPSYAKTKENQLLVINLRAAGWSEDQVATFLRCDPKTLRKHFSRELAHGALFLEGIALQGLTKRALEGNVTALKEVLSIARAANAPKSAGRTPKATPLGKKEQQARDAGAPPQGWGDLLDDAAPKLPN
jgi:hypothetical protein